jgi:hypothetical protein
VRITCFFFYLFFVEIKYINKSGGIQCKKVKVELSISNLDRLSSFAHSAEMKDRLKKAQIMLQEKTVENLGG